MIRKKIALITVEPSGTYQHRLMNGIFRQCRKYDYDVVVISQFALACIEFKDNLIGETSIYELVDYSRFDGIVIDTLSVTLAGADIVRDILLKKLAGITVPVICLDQPLGNYPSVSTDTGEAVRELTEHLITVHNCKDIYMVTGGADDPVAKQRAEGYRRAMSANGLPCGDDRVFYTAFWYPGGEAAADMIINGSLKKPEAIVCASDQIAIGLIKRLSKAGIRVPEDIKVTGYDAASEGVVSKPTLTTCVPDDEFISAEAVRYLHNKIEDAQDSEPAVHSKGICLCQSCGCNTPPEYIISQINDLLVDRSAVNELDNPIDLLKFNESYMLETLAGADSPEECLQSLTSYAFLFEPYREFRLCLRKDWLTVEDGAAGLPKEMMTVMCSASMSAPENRKALEFNGMFDKYCFDAKDMLPELFDDHDKAQVFFFLPVHYLRTVLGYAVLQCGLERPPRPDIVIDCWFRSLNNALNTIRMQERLRSFSELDAMTGMLNRRGMERRLKAKLDGCTDDDMILAVSIDMDRLKYINDNFGHLEGDRCIRELAACISGIAGKDELCVRTGGDEFLLIGVGDYTTDKVPQCINRLRNEISKADRRSRSGGMLSASIGFAVGKAKSCILNELINSADEEMYKEKELHHRQSK